MGKFKNVGKSISLDPQKTARKPPQNLSRYRDGSKRTTKSNLTKGAFGKRK